MASPSKATLGQTSELDGSRLTPHFTLAEMTKTSVNKPNVPTAAQVENLKRLSLWLEMLRDEWKEDFDELLLERSPKGAYWLHFAVRPTRNRRKIRFIQA